MKILRMADLDLRGKRVFIRSDLNVPLDDAGGITDDTRIRASIPAMRLGLEKGAAVMVTSHLGRPTEGEFSKADSLAPVARSVGQLLGREVPLKRDWVDGVDVKPGEVVLLENCRFNKGEKKDDEALARKYGGAVRRVRERRVRHRAPRRGDHARHREACEGRVRGAAARRRARGARARARQSEAPARGDRRRLEGLHQAHDPEIALRKGSTS